MPEGACRWLARWAVLGWALSGAGQVAAQLGPPSSGGLAAAAMAERMMGHHLRILVIGAHPDDEDTELLALGIRGLGAETAYLALNRGEGGQNAIGQELGEAMGVLRTEELLAARQVDGARQYFTRAYDFGFSKSLDDTWNQWPRDSVLKDAVRAVRAFRPQIVVSVFSGTPRDGHGQHQAAGWVAREAFRLAGDSTRFPELQLELGLAAWRPEKLYRSTRFDQASTTVTLDGGVADPVVGRTYHQLAMESRSRHRSQDMGQLQTIGASAIRMQLLEDRTGHGTGGFLDGVDTSLMSASMSDVERADLRRHAMEAAAARAGVLMDAVAEDDRLIPGGTLGVTVSVANVPATARSVRVGMVGHDGLRIVTPDTVVRVGGVVTRTFALSLDALPAWAQPYFLRVPRDGNLYHWPTTDADAGRPFEAPPLLATAIITLGDGTELQLEREVTFRQNLRSGGGERRRPIAILPAVSLTPEAAAAVWPLGGGAHAVRLTVTHHGASPWRGQLRVRVPDGWAAPAAVPVALEGRDEVRTVIVPVTVPRGAGAATLRLEPELVDSAGAITNVGIMEIRYDHVRPRWWTVPAAVRVTLVPMSVPRLRIGYVRGTADRVPEALRATGLDVALLDSAALATTRFEQLDAVVIGPRAYETVPGLAAASTRLRAFAAAGGAVLVQYQNLPFIQSGAAPFPLTLGGDRVTDEGAPVMVRDSGATVLQRPNRIGAEDWQGWVQERGLQFGATWDAAWQAPLAMHDPGEPDRNGSLLVARVGTGAYVYTGLSLFRQLPAGVAGAMRFFVNLLSLGTAGR